LWDVGFQLSLGATLGLVLYADRLQKGFEGWVGRWLPQERAQAATAVAGEVLLLTLSAQIRHRNFIGVSGSLILWVLHRVVPVPIPSCR